MAGMSADDRPTASWWAGWVQAEERHHTVVSEAHWDALRRRTHADLEREGLLADHPPIAQGTVHEVHPGGADQGGADHDGDPAGI